jgi:hypothetical protein
MGIAAVRLAETLAPHVGVVPGESGNLEPVIHAMSDELLDAIINYHLGADADLELELADAKLDEDREQFLRDIGDPLASD